MDSVQDKQVIMTLLPLLQRMTLMVLMTLFFRVFFNSLLSHLSHLSRIWALLSLLWLCLLSGCSTFSSSFDCDRIGGIKGCVSMSEVYAQSSDDLSYFSDVSYAGDSSNTTAINDIKARAKLKSVKGITTIPSGSAFTVPAIGQPVRVGDTIQKMMIFDYIDSEGNYNEPSIVYTVLRGANWLNHSVHAVKAMGDE
ncbi:type IV conjugative transfer system lipoprotein TraV [Cysteiniphilum halobium]|uniref:type IV conjugative transfer system lipoprotein TraV n=1 Tax=Cysteiniphilum halobium TaxID=2219059 RepID=UPI000E653E1B|nr:type IV conjugative transfer system lipoprotein TraV [Cysteiniphilum halobium]